MTCLRALLLAFLLSAGPVLAADPITPAACGPADSGSPCGGAGPASQGNSSNTNQGAGNPINVITGNKHQREVDLPALPGVLGLEIVRYYNSALADAPPGILGRGWRLSYETELYATGNTVQLMQADGTRILFIRDPANPSRCATDDPARGTMAITRTPHGEAYVWTWTDGRVLSFNAQGKLVQIKAATGEFVSLTRDPSGLLVKVTDPQGRSLVLGYPSRRHDRFNGVSHIDSPVGRFVYAYGTATPTGHAGIPRELLANLASVTLPDRIVRRYRYDDARFAHHLTALEVGARDAAGRWRVQRLATWAYDINGRGVLSVKGWPAQRKDGRPVPGTGIEQVTLAYAPGRTTLTNSLGQTTTYTHAIVGNEYRLLEVTGAGCASCGEANVKYGYDRLGRLTTQTRLRPDGQPLSTRQIERDALGRVVRESRIDHVNGKPQPARLLARYQYAGDSPRPVLIARPSVIPGREAVTRIAYNDRGQPLSVSESGFSPLDDRGQTTPTSIARTTRYAYRTINNRSLLTTIDGPLANGPKNDPADSDVTRIEWDRRGDFQAGLVKPGKLVSRVAARDEAGRPVAVRETDGVLTRIAYAYTGQTTRIERAGRVVAVAYDARQRPVAFRANDGRSVRIAYLPDGTQRTTLPDGQTLEESYNSERQVTSSGWLDDQGRALGTAARYRYDDAGRLAGFTSPAGLDTRLAYADDGELSHWRRGKMSGSRRFDPATHLLEIDVAGARYRAQADAAGLTLTLPTGAVHGEWIDDFGRVVRQISPERGIRSARYDAADRTLEVRDAVRLMTARYDAAGRMLERRHQNIGDSQERRVRYIWQGVHLVRIDDAAQTTEYTYDANGRRLSERITLKTERGESQTHTTRYRYDALGRLHRTVLPEGATLTQHYDAIGRASRVDYQPPAHAWWVKAIRWAWADYGTQPLVADIKSDSAHGLLGYVHGNDEKLAVEHDAARRPIRLQDGASDTRLAYNADEEIARLARNSQTLDLGYDLRGRLQRVVAAGQGQTSRQDFALDANGNRLELGGTQFSGTPSAYAYRPHSDQLLAEADRRYVYNAVGEPVQIEGKGQRTLSYDPLGQLAQVVDNGREVARYRYNQHRQRIAKTVNGKTTYFLWQGGAIAAEADAQGHIEKRYVYLGSRPVAMIAYDDGKATRYAIHTDHLGTPLMVSDADRNIVWQADYEVYGRASVRTHSLHVAAGPPGNGFIASAHASAPASFSFNLRLPGQYEDAETGWHYNFHRYYNPDTGRYLTPDPIGLQGGTNLYTYVDGDPAAAGDPWGLDAISANGVTTFKTEFADLPIFTIPTLAGWVDYKNSDFLGHKYNQKVSVSGLKKTELENLWTYIVDHPTPNSAAFPATFAGTYNPASPDYGPFSKGITSVLAGEASPDDVISFLRTGISGRTYVVNVTTDNHSLKFGIVVRGIHCENGKAIFDNYGEGNSVGQAVPILKDVLINDIWYWATEDALEKVTGRKYSIRGKDWNENN